jgi:hypothetical protein
MFGKVITGMECRQSNQAPLHWQSGGSFPLMFKTPIVNNQPLSPIHVLTDPLN